MADFFEQAINNYSGLSTETKPTIAAGNNVPNGSRWREVDTGNILYFNKSTDGWYALDEYIKSVSGAGPVVDIRALDIFEQVLTTLKKIEYHLAIASDTNLNDQDV